MIVICPYDTVERPDGRIARRCAVARYIPTVPNKDGATWDEVETLNNHTVVDIQAPQAVLDTILADPDFVEAKPGSALTSVLARLGFTPDERAKLPADPRQLKDELAKVRSEVTLSPDKKRIIVGGRKVAVPVSKPTR